jgi:hypothetical protein
VKDEDEVDEQMGVKKGMVERCETEDKDGKRSQRWLARACLAKDGGTSQTYKLGQRLRWNAPSNSRQGKVINPGAPDERCSSSFRSASSTNRSNVVSLEGRVGQARAHSMKRGAIGNVDGAMSLAEDEGRNVKSRRLENGRSWGWMEGGGARPDELV